MDEGLKRKLVGAVVLMAAALIVLPQITSSAKNAEHLAASVPIESSPPSMDMPLPKSLSIPVTDIVLSNQVAGEGRKLAAIKVDTETLPASYFEVPVKTNTDQAVVWIIQVGSFAKLENALNIRNKLRKAGYKAFEQLAQDGIHTRVFVGPSTQKTALEAQLKAIYNVFKLKGELKIKPVK